MTGISGHGTKPYFDIVVNNSYLKHENSFSDVSKGQPFWYVSSNDHIEIVVNGRSATKNFCLVVGSKFEYPRSERDNLLKSEFVIP